MGTSKELTFEYVSNELGLGHWDPSLNPKLIGIALEYDTLVANNNNQIFTKKVDINGHQVKVPASFQERLKAQNYAIAQKMKLLTRYGKEFTKEEILSAIISYKP